MHSLQFAAQDPVTHLDEVTSPCDEYVTVGILPVGHLVTQLRPSAKESLHLVYSLAVDPVKVQNSTSGKRIGFAEHVAQLPPD